MSVRYETCTCNETLRKKTFKIIQSILLCITRHARLNKRTTLASGFRIWQGAMPLSNFHSNLIRRQGRGKT